MATTTVKESPDRTVWSTSAPGTGADDNDKWVGFFSTKSNPMARTGTGLTGHGVDLVIDLRDLQPTATTTRRN